MSEEEERDEIHAFFAGLKPGDRFRFGDIWVTVTAVLPRTAPEMDLSIKITPDQEGPTVSA